MQVIKTARHFEVLEHPVYPPDANLASSTRLAQCSSASGDDNLGRPGTSFLWLGEHHHLRRDEVRQLLAHLQAWLDTGSLNLKPETKENV